MRAREEWRAPSLERIGLEAAREQHSMTPLVTELALELTWPHRRHRAESAQAEQVQSLLLLCV
ncbi:MAG: hypothetical protein AUI15_40105 [Actinobacteria bacterium 13_2_20CM_2_66_6]|nr:MAG: hypothetical protein AUI15_40105 [Actinobacteria bacterium 13_2_20CM_2_66_6]